MKFNVIKTELHIICNVQFIFGEPSYTRIIEVIKKDTEKNLITLYSPK